MSLGWLRPMIWAMLVAFPAAGVLPISHLSFHLSEENHQGQDDYLAKGGCCSHFPRTDEMACSEASEVTYSGPGSSMDFCPLSRPSQNEGSSDSGLPCSCPCSLCSLVKGACCLPDSPNLDLAPCLEAKVLDTISPYTPPFLGKLIRPPRV